MPDQSLTIFSAFHKPYQVPLCDFIIPIQVGKALTDVDLGFIKDDEGENISEKNPSFCETTALYWIWKHLDSIDSKFIGLAHYRRYFVLPEVTTKKNLFSSRPVINTMDCYVEDLHADSFKKVFAPELETALLKELNSGKVVMPAKAKLYIGNTPVNARDFYIYYHILEDWLFVENTICLLFPDYNDALKQFSAASEMHCYNMFIGDKHFVEGYCTWLFAVFNALEKHIKLHVYPYQHRVFGFVAERLLNVYIIRHQLQTATFPVIFFKD